MKGSVVIFYSDSLEVGDQIVGVVVPDVFDFVDYSDRGEGCSIMRFEVRCSAELQKGTIVQFPFLFLRGMLALGLIRIRLASQR